MIFFFQSQFKMSTVVIEIVKKLCASSITPLIKSHVLNILKKNESHVLVMKTIDMVKFHQL